jgi:phosphatidylglycerol:prolipoprotein diacylglycerol transferase
MHRVLVEVPGTAIRLHSFGLMLCLAFLAAIALAAWRARREGLDPDSIYDLALWAVLGSLIGARLFYVVEYWGKGQVKNWLDIFKIWEGGIVFYGGLAGGTVACLAYAIVKRLPVLKLCDILAPSLALGLAIGRVGCFLNGCCYGDECALPWAVTFPPGSAPWWDQAIDSVEDPGQATIPGLTRDDLDRARRGELAALPRSAPVHPTQLYSAVDGLILWAVLTAYYPYRRRDGRVMALFLMAYPVTRSLIEYLRDDEPAACMGLTISQVVGVATLAAGLALWLAARPPVRAPDPAISAA